MGWATAFTIISYILTAVSIAHQMKQAKKMRQKAKDAAEARKGFELVTEGTVENLPIPYGRNLIGGARVWHATNGSYSYTGTNADKFFQTGYDATPPGGYTLFNVDYESGVSTEIYVPYSGFKSSALDAPQTGNKNEFLFYQQALCQGKIHAVYDVIIDEALSINDPSIGSSYPGYVYRGGEFVDDKDPRAALRIDYHYAGGVADKVIFTNFGERSTAVFTKTSYFSVVARIDRDEPQFEMIPMIQSFCEGREVNVIEKVGEVYQLSAAKVYTNNPVFCLLDYMMDTISGRGLPIGKFHLSSWYKSSLVCAKIVQTGVYVGGKIWQPVDGSRSVLTRDLPLYECNLIVDVTKPIRDNIEAIMQTMGDARLIWSQGQYKLLLQYPESNEAIELAGTITDDDLVHDSPIDMPWPGADQRLNCAVVRFHNEANDFKEDSVSWPPKQNLSEKQGVGGKRYLPVSGWDADNPGGIFLNNYGVWNANTSSATFKWKWYPKLSGTFVFSHTADDNLTFKLTRISNGQVQTTSYNNWRGVGVFNTTVVANELYEIEYVANDTGGAKGLAFRIVDPVGLTILTSRDPSYQAFIDINVNSSIYDAFLAEDNGAILESDAFIDGITDYYHALAKAEELVRVSRSASTVKFKYRVTSKYYEPGDYIKFESETIRLGIDQPLYLRVDDVKVTESNVCEVVAARFDYRQLAWNVKDNENVIPPALYSFVLTAPANLIYTMGSNNTKGSPGTLTWDKSPTPEVVGYVLYFHEAQDLDTNGHLIWTEIGRSSTNYFEVPDLGSVGGLFGVRAMTSTKMSNITRTKDAFPIDAALYPPTVTDLTASLFGDYNQMVRLQWTLPPLRISGTPYDDHSYAEIYRRKGTEIFSKVGTSLELFFVESPAEFGALEYKIRLVSNRSLVGKESNVAAVTIDPNNVISADSAIVYAYKRAAVAPTDNPGPVTYNFASSSISAPPVLANGWLRVIPSGPEPLYVTTAPAYSSSVSDDIAANEWTPPSLLAQSGINTAAITLYQRTDSLVAPPVVNDAIHATYTFATGALANPPNNWVRNMSTLTVGKYWWAIQAVAISSEATDNILDTEWTTPTVFSSEGYDATFIDLLSESDVVFANNDGLGYILPVGNTARMYEGGTLVTAGITFSGDITKNGLTLTVHPTSGGMTLAGANWNTNSESFVVSALYKGKSYQTAYSITKSRKGDNAVIIDLVFDTDTVQADSSGLNYVLPSGNAIKLYSGGAQLITGVVYGPANTVKNGLQATVNTANGVISLAGSSWVSNSEAFTFTATYNSVVYTIGYTIAKAKQGIQGTQGLQGIQGPGGTQGIAGPPGANGQTSYFHIKYSNDGGISFTGNGGENVGDWMGTYVDFTAADSGAPASYLWALTKGAQGPQGGQGIPGSNGANGQTSYLHIKYSNDGGNSFTPANPSYPLAGEQPGDWIGQYTDFVLNDSNNPASYTWSKTKGDQGIQGPQGPQGGAGASNHRCYKVDLHISPPSSPPPNTSNGAAPPGWSLQPAAINTLNPGYEQFQSDGVTAVGSNTTVWGTPYPSYFKVGSLDAITANIGTFTSAPAGSSRVLIKDDVIKVYEGNSLRVLLGNFNG